MDDYTGGESNILSLVKTDDTLPMTKKEAYIVYSDLEDDYVEFDYMEMDEHKNMFSFYEITRKDSQGETLMKLTMMVNRDQIRSISLSGGEAGIEEEVE